MRHSKTLSLIPAGEFETVYVYADKSIHRMPIVGWALETVWECPRMDCLGESCDYEHEPENEIIPKAWLWCDEMCEDASGSNSFVVPKGTPDMEILAAHLDRERINKASR